MNSGHLRETIMRTYNVSKDQAQGMMDVLKTMSDNYHKTYMKGVTDGYKEARKEMQDDNQHFTG